MRAAKILVEDHQQFLRFIVSTLQGSASFQVIEASSGFEALQKAEELLPDLILLDIGLPGLHGTEVARRLPQLVPTSKILFVSQESSAEVVQEPSGLEPRDTY